MVSGFAGKSARATRKHFGAALRWTAEGGCPYVIKIGEPKLPCKEATEAISLR